MGKTYNQAAELGFVGFHGLGLMFWFPGHFMVFAYQTSDFLFFIFLIFIYKKQSKRK